MSECVFCNVVSGVYGTEFLYQDDLVVAFRDVRPQAPVHVLLVPRRHTPSLVETDDPALLGALLSAARTVAGQLGVTDFRVVINTGAHAGQSVFHLHVHLLAGRPLAWPPG
jgi:histidine triad (HIT) family protein